MGDLQAYLASKYMSGPKADAILARADSTHKKKKKKAKNEDHIYGSNTKVEESGGLMLKDEDDTWASRRRDEEDDGADDAPVIGRELATFKKSMSQWSKVANKSAIPLPQTAQDEVKVEVKDEPDAAPPPPPVQVTKRKGGLRTAAQMQEDAEREAAAMRSPSPISQDLPDPTETVHRDATGRVIDVNQLHAEEKRRQEEERQKEAERKEWTKGMVQRNQREERAKMEKEMSRADVGRTKDDVRMNKEMQEEERWNDPAAAFLTKKKKHKGPRKPKYEGSWAPNRFSIAPGFRWDGVDRGNGFEKKFFQAQNTRAREQYEHNQWSMEDM